MVGGGSKFDGNYPAKWVNFGWNSTNHAENEDELRQLKAEIYRSLMREVSGAKMVAIGEAVIRLLGARRP